MISVLDKIKVLMTGKSPTNTADDEFFNWMGFERKEDMTSEATYFTCIKILSESVGKLSIKSYQKTDKGREHVRLDDIDYVLNVRPNPYMTPTTFWTVVERNRNHYGNAYVWCQYRGNKIENLWIMQSDSVQVYIDNKGYFGEVNKIYYEYIDPKTGKRHLFKSEGIMHFKSSYTYDGVTGIPVRDILGSTIEGSLSSQQYMNKVYKDGLTGRAVLQYTGDISKEAMKKIKKVYEEFATGVENSGKIIPAPLGVQLQPLNIKLTDAQFFELKKYSSLQIAAAFGIKPNHINNYDKSSYSNSETQQLSYYVDTLLVNLKQYEEEITYKLLLPSQLRSGIFLKYNEKGILRADSETQMRTLSQAVNNGIYTPNEAREYLDKPSREGGDLLMTNGNYIPITDVGKQYNKGGENQNE